MNKQHYFFKLIPPRPTFPQDITDQEILLMKEHALYFREQFAAGRVLLYGPVMAKDGTFGLAILEVADESEARHFGENDPSVRARLNRFEIYPMQLGGAQASRADTPH
ncbi:MAG TPA: YciI family protein [Candidatus Acidoferrales bacterium]|nr:YciI family protein [Candidatus Acidoferrales bacterium]